MSHELLYCTAGAIFFFMGLYSLIADPSLIKKVISFNVMGSGIFLLLVTFAERSADQPDPVPHAMVLTGIVVTVAVTAFALALIRCFFSETGRTNMDDDSSVDE